MIRIANERDPLIPPAGQHGVLADPNANLAHRVVAAVQDRFHHGLTSIRFHANLVGRALAYIGRNLIYLFFQTIYLLILFTNCLLSLPILFFDRLRENMHFNIIATQFRLVNQFRPAPQLYRFFNRLLKVPEIPKIPYQQTLDPSINPIHFQKGIPLNEVPPITEEVNLDELAALAPVGIYLQAYIDQVKVGCIELVGTPSEPSKFTVFKDRLQLLAKHIILYLKSGKACDDKKFAICSMLEGAIGNCGPRHMQETERAYDACLGRMDQSRSPEEKIYATLELLRIEIIDILNGLFAKAQGKREGTPHIRAALLNILGNKYHISGGSQFDPFAENLDVNEVEQAFFSKYSENEIIKRIFQTIIDAPRTEDQTDELIDLFKKHIPVSWELQIDPESNEHLDLAAVQYKYLEQVVYDRDGKITKEAVRNLLVGLQVLNPNYQIQ